MSKRMNIKDHVKELENGEFEISPELMAEILIQDIPGFKYEREDGSMAILTFTAVEKAQFMELLGWDEDRLNELRI
ncbi:hypothetical protein [Methanobacterium formicicum]|jgi:hypothetical protein|uniref:Uncharacterized protein n=1 Tax=Methanobacterium formicicum TaxID=2162 RepID=A0A0S4FR08_METFO|nr:hypothetical protein [Methanobacterium formicicum]CEL25437.1 hypothetical protein MB9_1807 [Methanobacterium formicicum]